jgi:uncharacterized delta-60 repeat protein
VKAKAKRLCLLLFFFAFWENNLLAASAATEIDPTFQPVALASDGRYTPAIHAVALQPDGKILVSGFFESVNANPRNSVARLNADGSLDPSFVPALPIHSYVTSMAPQPDGKILINHDSGHGAITRLNSDGSIDASFTLPPETSDWISAPDIYISPAGEIFLGGPQVRSPDLRQTNLFVARVSATGALEFQTRTHWYCACFMTEQGSVLLAFQADSKLIVGGYFSTDADHKSLARFNSDGYEDPTFDTTAVSQDTYPISLLVQPDDKIIYSSVSFGTPRFVRFNSDGTLDKRFPLPPKAEIVPSFAIQADRKVIALVAADYGRSNALVRFNADATVDSTFQSRYLGHVFLQPNGRILLTGSFNIPGPNGETNTSIIRLRGDPAFFSSASIEGSQIQLNWKVLDPTLSYTLQTSDDMINWTTVRSIAPGPTAITYDEPLHTIRFVRLLYD